MTRGSNPFSLIRRVNRWLNNVFERRPNWMPFWLPFVVLAFISTSIENPLGIAQFLDGSFPAARFVGEFLGGAILFWSLFVAYGLAIREPFPPAESPPSERPPWDA